MSQQRSRRQFLGQTAAISAGVWLGTNVPSHARGSALETLSAACIGVGGKGWQRHQPHCRTRCQIVGLCDVDNGTLTKKSREFPDAEQFQDFREMLDKLGDKVDIVTVSTPDHTHACAAMQGHEDEEACLLPKAADLVDPAKLV